MRSESANEKKLSLVHKTAIAGGALVLGIGLAACGGSSDSSTPAPTETTVSDGTNSADVAAGQLPTGWPEDLPVPANATVHGGVGTSKGATAAFEGTGTLKDPLNAYKSQLEADGWKLDKSAPLTADVTSWSKGSSRVNVLGAEDANGTYRITVTYVANAS